MVTPLYVFVAAAIGAAAFIFGRQIGYTQRNAELEKDRVKVLEEQVAMMDLEYRQLQVQYDQQSKDIARSGGYTRPGSWDPGNISDRQ